MERDAYLWARAEKSRFFVVVVVVEIEILALSARVSLRQIRAFILCSEYLSLPPTRHDLTQGQKPEGQLKWG